MHIQTLEILFYRDSDIEALDYMHNIMGTLYNHVAIEVT